MRARAGGIVIVATAIVAWLLFHPLRHASATGDDFAFLALGPHLDNPLVLLVQDSTGAYFFRPVVMLLWWATSALTREPAVHYAINVGLHALNGVLLFALLRRVTISPVPAALAALAFVAHPTGLSAAAWLSVRFDLVSLAFGLAALIAIDAAFRRGPARWRASVALVALLTLACVLSKETGFGIAAVALAAAAWPAPGSGATPRARLQLAAAIGACIVAALAIRWIVLRPAVEGMFMRTGTVATLWAGFTNWAAHVPGFVVVRQGPPIATWLWLAALALPIALAFTLRVHERLSERGLLRLVALGIALALVAALAQAPVSRISDLTPYAANAFDFRVVTSSRLYYVPLAGLCIAAAALGEAIARAPLASWTKRLAAAALGIAIAGLVAQSRQVGREVAAFTDRTGPVFLRPALEALERVAASPGCKIYLLGTPATAVHFREFLQSAVLQALPRGHPVTRCFLLSEHAPWYSLLAAEGLSPDAQQPLETIYVGGKPFEPLRVGNLTHYFLRIPDSQEIRDDPAATFLAFRNGRFVDVTADVRARRFPVRFFDNRPTY